MYYSEYLRNKKLAAAKIVSPTGQSSGLQTQILRYKSSQVQGVQSDGQSLMRSSEGVLGAKGHAAVCCVDTIKQPTVVQGCCEIAYNPTVQGKLPRGFYGPPRPDCPPVSGGPVIPTCCSNT